MSRSVSLLSLRNQVRKRADVEGATARHTDAEINEYINQSYADLYGAIADKNELYNVSSYAFNTANGTSTYALPADFWRALMVQGTYAGHTFEMDEFSLPELPALEDAGTFAADIAFKYATVGDNIQFAPTPRAIYAIKLWYTRAPQRMAADVDTVDGVAGWEEFVVVDAARKILQVDGKSNSGEMAATAEMVRKRVVASAAIRNMSQPKRFLRRFWRPIRRLGWR